MTNSNVTINLGADLKGMDVRPVSKMSKIFSEGSVSSYHDSDSDDDDDLGIVALKSCFLSHQSRPGTALASKARPNLNTTMQLAKKRLRVIKTLQKELNEDDIQWIKGTFFQKECTKFSKEQDNCFCGKIKDCHSEIDDTSRPWSDVHNCTILPTDAFGTAHMASGSYNIARFLRLSNDSDCDDILQLLRDFWHLNMPGIVMSFIGSGNTVIPHKLYQIIQRDIAKVGKLVQAWIFTGGMRCGVASVVGNMLATHGYPIPAIAFSNWGVIDNVSSLRSSDQNPDETLHYNPQFGSEEDYIKHLEPHNTHFLLVDDGTVKNTKCNEVLRKEFETYLSQEMNVPLVYIVVGGTEEDGATVCSFLSEGRCVLLVKGSGGFTDDFCDFHKHMEDQSDIPEKCSCFQGTACNIILKKMDHDFDINILLNVWKVSDRSLSIFDFAKEDNLDSFVLKQLVGSLKDNTLDKQLSLACTWSRVDIAEHVLSEQLDATKGAKYCSALTRTLFHALVWDHTDFCGVLIENGADIYDIQANLVSLYESAYFSPRCSHVIQLLEKYSSFDGSRRIRRDCVNELLDKLVGRGYKACTGFEMDPFYEMVLWAVLTLRDDLAILLWRYTEDPVRCALIAMLMLYSMKDNVYLEKSDDKRRVKHLYAVFEDLALSVINKAWLSDPDISRRAMLSKWLRLGSYNYLDLAFHSHARLFMAHPACQEIISAGWRGKFKRDTSFSRILIILLFPFLSITSLVPFDRKVSYRRAVQGKYKMIYIDKLTGVEAVYKRSAAFYSAPVTKFWLNLLLYFILLIIHSYTLLSNMRYITDWDLTKLAATEIVVWAWIGTWIIAELQDWIKSLIHPSSKLRYLSDSWNRMDIIILSLYVLGILLRVTPILGCFQAGRTVLAVVSVPMFFKLLMLFEYKPTLGPILLMLREMSKDLGVFLLLMVIFLLGFGVSYIALLIPPARFSWSSMSALFMYPYFQMFGDFYLEVFELAENSAYIDKTWAEDDPDGVVTKGQGIVSVSLLICWVMISTVVLVNLLIAMFSDTYRTIKDNQLIIWKYQRYKMLSQYRASTLAPPLNILHYMVYAIRKVVQWCSRPAGQVQPKPKLSSGDFWKDCVIRTFMQDARDEYLSSVASGKEDSAILNKLNAVEQHLAKIRRVGNKTSSLYA